jgi:small nuclear ribonucleoprotein E
MSSGATGKIQKVLTQPVNVIYRFLQEKTVIQVWLHENKHMRMEGVLLGFDQFMNLVLDSASEINLKDKTRRPLGKIMLKGDSIALIQAASA